MTVACLCFGRFLESRLAVVLAKVHFSVHCLCIQSTFATHMPFLIFLLTSLYAYFQLACSLLSLDFFFGHTDPGSCR